jgi:chain length determinant protein EpsF
VNVKQFFRVVMARWWVVILVGGAMVAATAAVSMILPRQYTATTTMVIEPRGVDALGGAAPGAQMLAQTYLATQIDVLMSERVAREVVKALGIDRNPAAMRQWQEATQGTGSIEGYFAELLTRKLEVKPSRESSAVGLSFTGSDPQFAAQVANSFAQTYMAISLELRNQPSKLYASWFDEQLKSLRADLEQAQAKVSAFQQRNGIVANDERLDIENSRLAELSQQLVLAQTQSVDARARSELSSANVRSIPEVGSTAVVQALRTEVLRAETRVQEASQQFGPAHPTLERLQAELASLRERLQAELGNANESVTTLSTVSNRRESGLRNAVAVQKQRVLQIKQQRDEMSTLQREAENAQRVFDVALQRLAQSRLESQNTQANAYILNVATAPAEASSPKVARNLVISAIMGLLAGVVSALLVEVIDRRIRSSGDIEAGLQVPMLGTVPRTSPQHAVREALGWRTLLPKSQAQ